MDFRWVHHTLLGLSGVPMDASIAGDEEWKCGCKLLGSTSRTNSEYSDGQNWERLETVLGIRRVDEEQEGCRIRRALHVLFIRRCV